MTEILVDTSVWRRRFSGKLSADQVRWFNTLLDEDGVLLMHPWILGELKISFQGFA